jgi:hypothetical protein
VTERHKTLEEMADDLLREDRKENPPTVLGADWFSEDQLALREHREIPVGLIQGGRAPGMYRRAYNPDIGKRPDPQKLFSPGVDPWDQALYEYYR